MSRLKDQYKNEIVDAMMKKFGYKNIMQVPKLDKIVVNMGVGEAKENAKVLESAVKDMETITGQKAILTKAKKSVANFKIREGMAIGCKKGLVVLADNDTNVIASAKNLEKVNTAVYDSINAYDVMNAGTLVLTKDAVAKIEEVYA